MCIRDSDWGSKQSLFISPDTWREFIKPQYERDVYKRQVLHRATLVIFEEGSYYCDVGYGGPGPKKPVLMKDGIHREKNGWYRVNMKPGNTNGEILVERRKEEKYLPILRFSQTPTVEADFELLNFYCAKRCV